MNISTEDIKKLLQDADQHKQNMINLCQQGNREAFTQFVQTYQDEIYAHALRMLNDEQEASKKARQTFVEA